jgi:hypothetical protein
MDGHHREIGKERMSQFLSIVTCLPDTLAFLDLREVTLDRVERHRLGFSQAKMHREEVPENEIEN